MLLLSELLQNVKRNYAYCLNYLAVDMLLKCTKIFYLAHFRTKQNDVSKTFSLNYPSVTKTKKSFQF